MKILVIQLKQLGDVLLSTPLPQAIKYHIKDGEVHFLTTRRSQDILTLNPFIDKIHILEEGIKNEIKKVIEIRREKFDAVLDVQRTGRTKRITLFSRAPIRAAFEDLVDKFYYNTLVKHKTSEYSAFDRLDLLSAIGIEKPKRFMPSLYFSQEDKETVDIFLKNKKIGNYFVLSPTARKPTKMWQVSEFGKLTQFLADRFNLVPIIVYGTEQERETALEAKRFSKDAIIIDKPFSIKELAALIKSARFFLGNDSFAGHVAVSQNTIAVIICGPTSGWFPNNGRVLSIYKGLECQPCNDPKHCKYNLACYKTLKYEETVDEITDFLKQTLNGKF